MAAEVKSKILHLQCPSCLEKEMHLEVRLPAGIDMEYESHITCLNCGCVMESFLMLLLLTYCDNDWLKTDTA